MTNPSDNPSASERAATLFSALRLLLVRGARGAGRTQGKGNAVSFS